LACGAGGCGGSEPKKCVIESPTSTCAPRDWLEACEELGGEGTSVRCGARSLDPLPPGTRGFRRAARTSRSRRAPGGQPAPRLWMTP
jgi:hypothetical protein